MTDLERVLARIDEVLRSQFGGSASEWCRKAGLSRSYIATMRSRAETGEVRAVKMHKLAALARAAGVTVDWLAGESDAPGSTGRSSTLRVDPRPSVEQAIQQYEWPSDLPAPQAAEVIRRARAEAQLDAEPLPVGYWLARLPGIVLEVTSATPAKSTVRQAKK